MTQRLSGLSEIAGEYDSLVCDIWGVVHNGMAPFPTAVAALQEFRRTGRPAILLSNAPRLASDVYRQLGKLNIPPDAYDAIVTSGEATRTDLAQRTRERTLPILHIGPARDNGVFEGLNVRLTDVNDADLILATGLYDDENETADDYRATFEAAAARGLVMICANPDVVVQRGTRLIPCAGALAEAYEGMGGAVIRYGKPHAEIFRLALAEARKRGGGARPLVIGDNLDTDILGANRINTDALFIFGGIHSAEAGHETAAALLAAAKVHARAFMNVLAW